jgi:hypothetical protein
VKPAQGDRDTRQRVPQRIAPGQVRQFVRQDDVASLRGPVARGGRKKDGGLPTAPGHRRVDIGALHDANRYPQAKPLGNGGRG